MQRVVESLLHQRSAGHGSLRLRQALMAKGLQPADFQEALGRLAETELHRVIADRWRNVPGGEPWHLLVGLYHFGPGDADIGLAAALGLLASQAGGPLLAAGDTALATAEPAALAGWAALRGSEAAPWLGFVAPRVLLRLPYGKRSDPLSTFAFEEFSGGRPEHEHLLWGAGSLAAALLIGRAFLTNGWSMQPGDENEVADLPAYTYDDGGEKALLPCAEHLLGERAGQALMEAGLPAQRIDAEVADLERVLRTPWGPPVAPASAAGGPDSAPAAMALVSGGRLRLLGHSLPANQHPLGDTPSLAATVPGYEFAGWIGLLGPKGLPPAVTATLVDAVAKAMQARELVQAFDLHGAVPSPSSPAEFRRFLERDIATNRKAVALAGIQPE